jgi:hypothetical protein
MKRLHRLTLTATVIGIAALLASQSFAEPIPEKHQSP